MLKEAAAETSHTTIPPTLSISHLFSALQHYAYWNLLQLINTKGVSVDIDNRRCSLREQFIRELAVLGRIEFTTKVRRSRGKSKIKKFKEFVDKHGLVDIQIHDKMRLPVGTHVTSWSRTISLVVYHHCDLHYENWTKLSNELKLMLENHVKSSFVLNATRLKLLRYLMRKSYSRIRTYLKRKNYEIYFEGIDEYNLTAMAHAKSEAISNVPEGFSQGKWKLICESFENPSWKTELTGVEPQAIEFFKDTHIRKDETFVNEEAERQYNEMKLKLNFDSVDCTQEEIMSQVLDQERPPRSGHVKGWGCDVIPLWSSSSLLRFTSQFDNHEECNLKMIEMETKYKEDQDKLWEEMEAKHKEDQDKLREEMKASEFRVREELEARIKSLLLRFGGLENISIHFYFFTHISSNY